MPGCGCYLHPGRQGADARGVPAERGRADGPGGAGEAGRWTVGNEADRDHQAVTSDNDARTGDHAQTSVAPPPVLDRQTSVLVSDNADGYRVRTGMR